MSTRRGWAALTSGVLVVGGLVAGPALVGLSTATAAPVSLGYTCTITGGGQSVPQDSTISLDLTVPATVEPGADVPVSVATVIDMGSAAFGPITDLAGPFDIPITVGDQTTVLKLPSSSAPVKALKFTGTATGVLRAPDALGAAPITVGTINGPLKTTPYNVDAPAVCVPDAGQDQTVGSLTVAEPTEPAGLNYTCVVAGPSPVSVPSILTVDISAPDKVAAGETFPADVSFELDMGTTYLGPVSQLTGDVDLDFLVGDQPSTVTIPIDPVTMTPSEPNHVVITGAGEGTFMAPSSAGAAVIAVGDLVGNYQATVFGTQNPTTIPCTQDAGQDATIGSIDVEKAAPVAVPVTGKVAIKGTPKVGKSLTAKPGKTDGATVTYQWLSNGKAVKKATSAKMKLTKSLAGKKLSVKATYKKAGFITVSQTSKAVKIKK